MRELTLPSDPLQALLDMLPSTPLKLTVSKADVRRMRAYMERFNTTNPEADPYDVRNIEDYKVLVHTFIAKVLDEDEKEHGLIATLDGHLQDR